MVRSLLLLACLVGLALAGAEDVPGPHDLRIADTIGETAVLDAAVRLRVRAGKPGTCVQDRVTLDRALAGLRAGKYDVVLAYRSALPEDLRGRAQDYAVEAAMIAVNAANVRSSFSAKDLTEIFSGWRKTWKTLNGENFQIHLMRLENNAGATEIFRRKIMGDRSFARAFVRRSGAELLRMTELYEHAVTLTFRPDAELSTGVKAAAVDGVYPSLENLKNGKYPLADRRVVLMAEKPSPEAAALMEFLRRPEMAAVFADSGLVMP